MGLEGPEDPMSEKTRELQDSKLFNQETVAKDGTLVGRKLSLSGKIIQRSNVIMASNKSITTSSLPRPTSRPVWPTGSSSR